MSELKFEKSNWLQLYSHLLNDKTIEFVLKLEDSKDQTPLANFIKGLIYEQKKEYAKSFEYYSKGAQAFDPLSSYRLCQIYADQKNLFQIQSNFNKAWFYLIIYCSLNQVFYGIKDNAAEQTLKNIIDTVDHTLENSENRIHESLKIDQEADLITSLFELHLTTDSQIEQLKYDKILQVLTDNLDKKIQQRLCYNIIIGLFSIDSNIKDKSVDDVFTILVVHLDQFETFIQDLKQQLSILENILDYKKEQFNHLLYLIFEAYHIKKGIDILNKQLTGEVSQSLNNNFKDLNLIFSKLYVLYVDKKITQLSDQLFIIRYYSLFELSQAQKNKNIKRLRSEKAMEIAKQELSIDRAAEYNFAFAYYNLAKFQQKLDINSKEYLEKSKKYYQQSKDEHKNDYFLQFYVSYYQGRIEKKLNPENKEQQIKYFQEGIKLYMSPVILNCCTFQFDLIYRKLKSQLSKLGVNTSLIQSQFKEKINMNRSNTYKQVVETNLNSSLQFQKSIQDPVIQSIIAKNNATIVEVFYNILNQKPNQSQVHASCLYNLPLYMAKDIYDSQIFTDLSINRNLLKKSENNKLTLIPIDQIDIIESLQIGGRTMICNIESEIKVEKYALKQFSFLKYDQLENYVKYANLYFDVSHKNILKYLGYSLDSFVLEAAYNFYLISDLKKTNLTYILKKNILDYKQKLNVSLQICSALVYLNQRNKPHINLKSNNILLDKDFNVFVSDWLISPDLDATQDYDEHNNNLTYRSILQMNEKTNQSEDVRTFGIILAQIFFIYDASDENQIKQQFFSKDGLQIKYGNQYQGIGEEQKVHQSIQQLIEKMVVLHDRITLQQVQEQLNSISSSIRSIQ